MGTSGEQQRQRVPVRLHLSKGLRVGLGLVFVLIVVLVAAIHIFDFNQYKSFITDQVKEVTGRQLRIEGDLELALSPGPAVVVHGVNFANAPWGTRFDMVKMGRFEAEISLLPLILGHVQVKRLALVEPDILLETDAQGRGNWEIDLKRVVQLPQPASNGEMPILDISEVHVERAHVTYRDGVSGQSTHFLIKDLSLRASGTTSPIALNLAAIFKDRAIYVSGTFGTVAALIQHTS
ncbi:MAG: AsmA family protein, partial [Gammaproteobacteria bacterium]|nr:AsmA family protein [Gammaproteobacteria bacterium]